MEADGEVVVGGQTFSMTEKQRFLQTRTFCFGDDEDVPTRGSRDVMIHNGGTGRQGNADKENETWRLDGLDSLYILTEVNGLNGSVDPDRFFFGCVSRIVSFLSQENDSCQ